MSTAPPATEVHLRNNPATPRKPSNTAYYVVGNSKYFLGLVALINSLRLVGHDEPIFVTDCGLTKRQRGRLAEEVSLVEVGTYDAPHLAKTAGPLAYPSDILILVDADIIVTRPLTELIETALSGKVVAFTDQVAHRFDERWSDLLELGELRSQPYMNSGLMVFPRSIGVTILEQVEARLPRIDAARTMAGTGTPDYPFYYLDQDVVNAVLASCAPEQLEILDHSLAPFPPFRGVRVIERTRLRCAYRDGREPFALHHILAKPWIAPTRWNVYSQLLTRLLLESDVAIPLRREEVPLRLRTGPFAWLEKRRCDALWVRRQLRIKLRSLIKERLRRIQPRRMVVSGRDEVAAGIHARAPEPRAGNPFDRRR